MVKVLLVFGRRFVVGFWLLFKVRSGDFTLKELFFLFNKGEIGLSLGLSRFAVIFCHNIYRIAQRKAPFPPVNKLFVAIKGNVKHNPGGGRIIDLQRYIVFSNVTLQESNIFDLEKGNIIFKNAFKKGDMLVP